MKGLIQRVKHASVAVAGQKIGTIDSGLLLFLAIEKGDTEDKASKLLDRILRYRVFSDNEDKMNLSLLDTQGELLIISQFTLAADTKKGLRPSFSSAATPEKSRTLFNQFVQEAEDKLGEKVAKGQFGADMQVNLLNDGPVTFMLEV